VPEASAPDPLQRLLREQALIVLDGALATELENRGADLRDPLWSAKCLIEQPHLIRAVHEDYFTAGADVAITATYQASFEGFAARGIGPESAARLMRGAVSLAADARDRFWSTASTSRPRPLVAASIGPYGAMLADGSEYRGRYAASDRELKAFHRPRLEVLCDAGADVLACETIPCLREALVLAELIEDLRGPAAWMSFSCADEARTCGGDAVAECAAELEPYARIGAIGINCSAPQFTAALIQRMGERSGKPLLAYPNSGRRYDAAQKCWVAGDGDESPGSFARLAAVWQRAGARLIGGCCRTTPRDIRELAAALRPPRSANA
jgi:homocysteine S-methyltransferase